MRSKFYTQWYFDKEKRVASKLIQWQNESVDKILLEYIA
jgi:hypothetical protein